MKYKPVRLDILTHPVAALGIQGVELDSDLGRPMSYAIERPRVRSQRALRAVTRQRRDWSPSYRSM
jgi:hypothetical protein